MNLLKSLCAVPGVSGDESNISSFILNYVRQNQSNWNVLPKIIKGNDFQDCLILVFGVPRTAIFAHMDTVGFTTGYGKELIKVGGPKCSESTVLIGEDSKGKIECEYMEFEEEDGGIRREYVYDRPIDRGTNLSYKQKWIEHGDYVQSCYMDNRLGIWNALKVCETLENGIVVFSTYEEHGGGSVGFLTDYIYRTYGVRQTIISDITWVTDGIKHGEGVAISMRDSGIPRRIYLNKILNLAAESEIPYQLEVESSGGSDGTAIQRSPYPVDWVFIGAPEDNVHSPQEKVHKRDIAAMTQLYKYLMAHL